LISPRAAFGQVALETVVVADGFVRPVGVDVEAHSEVTAESIVGCFRRAVVLYPRQLPDDGIGESQAVELRVLLSFKTDACRLFERCNYVVCVEHAG
jgi:hypothetical protein